MAETVYLNTDQTNEEVPTHDEEVPTDEPETDETFPRAYVEELRAESAKYRTRAKQADELATALWAKSVSELGKLADPSDLPMPEGADPLDAEVIRSAVDELLTRKPHLASRKPHGTVGQGQGNTEAPSASLGGLFRSLA